MKFSKFFLEAEKAGIAPFELKYSYSSELTVSIYQDELENYAIASDSSLSGRGMYKGNIGSFISDKIDNSVAETMISAIKEGAEYGHSFDENFFISKGQKYHHIKSYYPALAGTDPSKFIALAKDISFQIRKREPRITITQVFLVYDESSKLLENSKGLKLKAKSNAVFLYVSTKAEQGNQVESGYNEAIITDLASFDKEAFIVKAIHDTIAQLGGEPAKTGKYNVLFSQRCAATLLTPLLGQISSYNVSQHLSLFEGKIGQQVLSKKLTIKENPLRKTVFASCFDEEGMPTLKKKLIDHGVLTDYIYDLEMAKQYNKKSTGNGQTVVGNIHPQLGFIEVKPGTKSFEEILLAMKKGIYITSLDGIGTGLSTQSGDYSLQASGYLIDGGKLTKPVSLITVAGNLLKDFSRVMYVGDDSQMTFQGMETPSIAVRGLAISGK